MQVEVESCPLPSWTGSNLPHSPNNSNARVIVTLMKMIGASLCFRVAAVKLYLIRVSTAKNRTCATSDVSNTIYLSMARNVLFIFLAFISRVETQTLLDKCTVVFSIDREKSLMMLYRLNICLHCCMWFYFDLDLKEINIHRGNLIKANNFIYNLN